MPTEQRNLSFDQRPHRLVTLLLMLFLTGSIETTRLHRVAGLTGDRTALVTTRPCRAPHQTISDAGLIGPTFRTDLKVFT
jgi:predicted ATPase with chaperone activity